MRVISVAYLVFAPELPEPRAAATPDAAWVPVESGLGRWGPASGRSAEARLRPRPDPGRRAGAGQDQARVHAAGHRVRGQQFTIAELRAVYETVWGEQLHPGTSTARCCPSLVRGGAPARPPRAVARAAAHAPAVPARRRRGCCTRHCFARTVGCGPVAGTGSQAREREEAFALIEAAWGLLTCSAPPARRAAGTGGWLGWSIRTPIPADARAAAAFARLADLWRRRQGARPSGGSGSGSGYGALVPRATSPASTPSPAAC